MTEDVAAQDTSSSSRKSPEQGKDDPFQSLVAKLRNTFISHFPDFGQGLCKASELICDFFSVERVALFEQTQDNRWQPLSIWTAAGRQGVAQCQSNVHDVSIPPEEAFIRLMEQGVTWVSSSTDLESCRLEMKKYFAEAGLQAGLYARIQVEGGLCAAISIAQLSRERNWSANEKSQLQALGEELAKILVLRRHISDLEMSSRIETATIEILTRLGSDLSAAEAEERVDEALHLVASSLEADRVRIIQIGAESQITGVLASTETMVETQDDSGIRLPNLTFHLRKNGSYVIGNLEQMPSSWKQELEFAHSVGFNSGVAVVLEDEGSSMIVITLISSRKSRNWPQKATRRLKLLGDALLSSLRFQKAQSKLRVSESRHQAFMDSSPAYAYLKDETGRHIWGNQPLLEKYRLTLEQFKGTRSGDFFGKDQTQLLEKYDDKARSSGQPIVTEWYEEAEDRTYQDIKFPVRGNSDETLVGGLAFDITSQKEIEKNLRAALDEVKKLRRELEAENIYLRETVKETRQYEDIVGHSEVLRNALALAEQVADTDTTVLITGETGTGKELIARLIHRLSGRKTRPLIKVNCAALPVSLVESELFGREKGAYTGAMTKQIGRFELAHKGTILLDEIGELPLELQAKLLKVLQEGEFERLGGPHTVRVEARVIAATNQDLVSAVRDGSFRKDLFYRLNVFPILVPSLSERREDIPELVWHFVNQLGAARREKISSIRKRDMDLLQTYSWPGNVRELKNILERALILSPGKELKIDLSVGSPVVELGSQTLREVEKDYILKILNQCNWRVSGQLGAAEILGMKRTTLESRMKKLGIKRPKQ